MMDLRELPNNAESDTTTTLSSGSFDSSLAEWN
jgi:hypothetical protein